MKGGVKLTQFLPERKIPGMSTTMRDAQESHDDVSPITRSKDLNWEERMAKR